MKRDIKIGITGHRDIVQTKELKRDVREYLSEILSQNQESRITLLSPLADGADRFVADIFLDLAKKHKNLKLIVPMPFDQERYIEDFDKSSQKEFLDYLKIAYDIIEVENSQGCNYKSVGVYIADESDVLLALWDGSFNHKSGGTGDIVKYARGQGKEIIHFLCDREQNSVN
ncbi:hypothetical protein MNB_SV-12-1086 [hydrothermal vent metagenome]|uniref:Uncharacterized protein n=1 Tax=hydrothermal vent metagenome TaxID=652676 RepID=A0A1W1BBF5_9ZZZZ